MASKPKKNGATNTPPDGKGVGKGALAAMLAVAVAVLAAIIWMASSARHDEAVEWQSPRKKAAKTTMTTPGAPSAPSMAERSEPDPEAEERERRKAAYRAMTPDERWEYVVERARNSPLRTEPGTNRIFRTSTEQVMDWIFSCEVGAPPPLLPNLPMKEQFRLAEILISDNPIHEGDSDRAREAKETVQLVKKEFRDFIREGGELGDFLPYYHGQLVQAHEEWKAARKMAIEAVKNDPDIAAEFLSKVNERLAEKGIRKVTLPQKMLEHYGIELED